MANNIYYVEDLVSGGATNTLTDDGSGLDWLIFRNANSGNSISLAWWVDNGISTQGEAIYFIGNVGSRLIVNGLIENVRGGTSDDWITGNEANNILFGDALATGAGGNDTISAGAGSDTVYGGAGNDDIGGANDNDSLAGNAGDDTISGGDGADTLQGGAGADSLSGGANEGDTVSYSTSGAGVRLSFTYGTTTFGAGGDAAGDHLNGFRDAIGSNFGDVIIDTVAGAVGFDYNANKFNGGLGGDRLTLGGGNDTGIGGGGNDTIFGGQGDDTIDGGGNDDLIQGNAGVDTLSGAAGSDNLDGGDGTDTLSGGAGNDTVAGGLGADMLSGDTGADVFVFTTVRHSNTAGGIDTITDFSHAQHDRIDLSAIDANGTLAGDAAFHFLGTAAFSGAAAEVRIVALSDGWKVLADLDGDRSADFVLTLTGPTMPALVAADFVL
ncbi:putative secreted protein (type I secretion substrate) [Rhodobacter viridis]|uniref:Putative secreted protein (Type I secretion substrate) n=1 Tax=Rhodobacter viridis TaxID=1054202 RepID=A0A318TXF3_9RHOB|nr:calcium-binding protein [Rhodobacter viridis]PYF09334.1 putative secreted protein (type I secretion substrate) [Rhodobacter viridis]